MTTPTLHRAAAPLIALHRSGAGANRWRRQLGETLEPLDGRHALSVVPDAGHMGPLTHAPVVTGRSRGTLPSMSESARSAP